MKSIAIIGAGIAGLTLAKTLKNKARIKVFEKSRGLSGRISTRYTDKYQFNHGASCFTARSKAFKEFIQPLIDCKEIQVWEPRLFRLKKNQTPSIFKWSEPHYIAIPKMNIIAKKIAEGCDIILNTRITEIKENNGRWELINEEASVGNDFDWVISTAPAPQTQELIPPLFKQYKYFKKVKMLGCFSLMIGMEPSPEILWDAAYVDDSPISWITTYPHNVQRDNSISITAQTRNQWAEDHLEDDIAEIQSYLVNELRELLSCDFSKADFVTIHRWRYAKAISNIEQNYLLDENNKLAVCGDWCIGNDVEAAFMSSFKLSEKIRSYL